MIITKENSALELIAAHPWMSGFRSGNETQQNGTLKHVIENDKTIDAVELVDKVKDLHTIAPKDSTSSSNDASKDKKRDKKHDKKTKNRKKKKDPVSMNMTRIMETYKYHPHMSPRNGTDISDSQQLDNC
jgi:hypothetical protein